MDEQLDRIMSEDAGRLLGGGSWREIVLALDEGIHIVDQQARTILYNHSAGRMDGLRPEEVLDRSIFEVFPSLTFENSTLMQTLKSGKEVSQSQQTFVNMKGEQITTVNKTVPVIFSGGSRGAMEISRDITLIQELAENISSLRNRFSSERSAETSATGSQETKSRFKSNNTSYTFADLVGENREFKKVMNDAVRAAGSDSSVLIIGETGTGKELFAQGIHNASSRAAQPFIAQNCAALPRELLESLLFGAEKGSFTGAATRPGLFEQASGGTILLDEINSLDYDLQAKLLRVLQEGKVRRVGGQQEKEVDVRVLATMNQPPEEAFAAGSLRQDLFYRLSVICLSLPPLRRRRDDIPLLLDHFFELYNSRFNRRLEGITAQLKRALLKYDWPGNVRELQHMIECGFNLVSQERKIGLDSLPLHQREKLSNLKEASSNNLAAPLLQGEIPELESYLAQVEKKMIIRALNQSGGNKTDAGKMLGISRQSLQYKLKKYHLE